MLGLAWNIRKTNLHLFQVVLFIQEYNNWLSIGQYVSRTFYSSLLLMPWCSVYSDFGYIVFCWSTFWTHVYNVTSWPKAADNFVTSCSDGLHFTPSGNKILFDEVLKTLESVGFSQHSLRSDLPLFHEIDPKDPLKAFEIWRRYLPHGWIPRRKALWLSFMFWKQTMLVWWLMCSVTWIYCAYVLCQQCSWLILKMLHVFKDFFWSF